MHFADSLRTLLLFSAYYGLVTLAGFSHERFHLIVRSKSAVVAWLDKFPNNPFTIYAHEQHAYDAELRLGYETDLRIVNGELLEKLGCPNAASLGLCIGYQLGGVVVDGDSGPDTLPTGQLKRALDDHQSLLFKRRTDSICPWCINGYFVADSTIFFAPKKSKTFGEALSLMGQGHSAEKALTMAARKNLRESILLSHDTSVQPAKRTESLFFSFMAFASVSTGISNVLRLKATTTPRETIKIKVSSGQIQCGNQSGPVIEAAFDTQARYNQWLSTCTLLACDQPIVKIFVSMGNDRVDIPVYNPVKLVSIVVKTHGRMNKVMELVESVGRLHSGIKIIVGDDGADATRITEGQKRGFDYVPLSYDVGLSEGRNRLVRRVETPCVLFLDDDFIVTDAHSLLLLLHELHNGLHDMVAAKSPHCDTDYSGAIRILQTRAGAKMLLLPIRKEIESSSCERVDIVPNLFMTRTSYFSAGGLRWDPELKLGEHEAFFLKVKKLGLRVATCPGAKFYHQQTPENMQDGHYRKMRGRASGFLEIFLRKAGLVELVAFAHSKASLQEVPRISRLAQGLSAHPFSASMWIETKRTAAKLYVIEITGPVKKGVATSPVVSHLANPDGLNQIDFPLTALEPGSLYKVQVKPANSTFVDQAGPTLRIRTASFWKYNLLANPNFDGSTRGWRPSLGAHIGLIALFFPHHDPDYERRKRFGYYHEHIPGRPSKWAFANRRSKLDRNFACCLSAPPTTSFVKNRPEHYIYQDVPVADVASACLDGEQKCLLAASGWVRVDKVWGEPNQTQLFFRVRIMRNDTILTEYKRDLNPFQITNWQYSTLDSGPVMLPPGTTGITVAVGLKANVGNIFVDDFFLSVRPYFM